MENANNEVKTPKTTKQKVIFGLKIGGNVIFYLVIIFLFLFSLMNINSGGKGGIPNLFGKGMLSVQSNSMTIDDSFEGANIPKEYENYKIQQFSKGDLLFVDVINGNGYKKLKEGDVVTFYDTSISAMNTHRIVNITTDSDGNYINISLQGDLSVSQYGKYDLEDTSVEINNMLVSSGEVQTISDFKYIKAKVTGINRGGGKVLDNIQQNWLFYFVIPVLALLLFEVFMVIKNVTDLRNEKAKAALATDKDAMMAEIEAEREKIRQELL